MHLLLTQKFIFGVLSDSNHQYTVNLGQYVKYNSKFSAPLPSVFKTTSLLVGASAADFGRDLPTPLPTRLPPYSMYFLNKQNTVISLYFKILDKKMRFERRD